MSEAMRRLPNLLIASLGLRKAFSFLKLNAFLLKLNAFLKDCSWSSTRGSQNLQHCSLREVPGSAPGVLPDSLRECSRIASGSAPGQPPGVLPGTLGECSRSTIGRSHLILEKHMDFILEYFRILNFKCQNEELLYFEL